MLAKIDKSWLILFALFILISSFLVWLLLGRGSLISKCGFEKPGDSNRIMYFGHLAFAQILQISGLILEPAQIISDQMYILASLASDQHHSFVVSILGK